MTLSNTPPARPEAAPLAHVEDLDRMLTPLTLWKRYGLPRDLIYRAIEETDLPAYNAGRGGKPRYLVSLRDFLAWRETLRVGAK